jgi:hypothetical protein
MKILLDDVLYRLEDEDSDELLRCGDPYEFNRVLKMVLTEKQFSCYSGYDTRRTFTLSKKKEKLLFELIKMRQQ